MGGERKEKVIDAAVDALIKELETDKVLILAYTKEATYIRGTQQTTPSVVAQMFSTFLVNEPLVLMAMMAMTKDRLKAFEEAVGTC